MKHKRFFVIIIYNIFLFSLIFFLNNCSSPELAFTDGITVKDSGNISPVIDVSTFPDDNFRNFLLYTMALVTLEDCSRIKVLAVEYKSVENITGIRYFTAAEEIFFAHNNIVSIPPEFNRTNLPNVQLIDFTYNSLSPTAKNDVTTDFADIISTIYLDP